MKALLLTYTPPEMDEAPSSSSSGRSGGPRKGQVQIFLSWDGTAESEKNVSLLKKFLHAKHYFIHEHAGAVFGSGSVLAEVPEELAEKLKSSTVLVTCVSKPYTRSLSCKKVSLLARELKLANPKTAPEVCFAMIDGNYTTESQPYKVSGWLGFLLKDSLWSPSWTYAHCAGAAEAIMGTVNLKRKVVVVTKEELRAIDRGEELPLPTKGSPKSSSKGSSSKGGKGSVEGFPTTEPAAEPQPTPTPTPLKGILKQSSSSAVPVDDYAGETFE